MSTAEGERPRIVHAPVPALVVAPIRLVAGIAAVVAAGALELGAGRAAALAAFGGALFFFLLIVPGGRTRPWQRAGATAPLPADAEVEPLAVSARRAILPSTAGVAILAGLAVLLDRRLTALLGGILVSMGLAALLSGLLLLWDERSERVRLFLATDGTRRRFIANADGGGPAGEGRLTPGAQREPEA